MSPKYDDDDDDDKLWMKLTSGLNEKRRNSLWYQKKTTIYSTWYHGCLRGPTVETDMLV